MASRAVKESFFLRIVRLMLGTDGVVRTKTSQLQCLFKMRFDPPPNLNQSAQSAFSIRARRVEKNPAARIIHIDAFADRTRGVSAFERDRGDQEMR